MPLLVYVVATWVAGLFVAAFAHAAGRPELPPALAAAGGVLFAVALLRTASDRGTPAIHGVVPGAVSGTALPGSRARPRALHLSAVLAAAVASLLLGHAHWSTRAACLGALDAAARAAQQRGEVLPFEIVIDEPVAPRGYVRGHVSGRGALGRCTLPASIRVRAGEGRAGDVVVVHGTALTTDRAVRFDGEIQPTGKRRAPLRAMRARAGSSIDSLFGTRAPLVRALLIADQDGIDPELRDRFAEAGIVHLLSISGLHVAIIAESLLVLTTALRLSRTAASISSLVIVAFYVLLLGAPPSAVRSAVMMTTVTLSERMQRPVHTWTALALGAWLPTLNPGVVVHLGWQLSVGGMAALVAARDIMRRIRTYERRRDLPRGLDAALCTCRDLRGWQRVLLRELLMGVMATSVTAPLIAWHFGRVSIIAPLSNVAAGPIVGFLQPALFLSLLLAPLQPLAAVVADACAVPLLLLDAVATAAARVPYAALRLSPGLFGAACAGGAAALLVRATASPRMMPGILMAAAALAAGVWVPLFSRGPGVLELHMIDVGQGDAIALRTPRGRWILVDAGRSWEGGDSGRRMVVPYVRRLGGGVAAFILSHAHDDHVGGAASVIEALAPARWIEPAFITTTTSYRKALDALERRGIAWRRVHPADSLMIDGVVLRILGPDSAWTAHQTNPNEASVVLMAEYRGARFLLTGDAEGHEEAWLVERWGAALRADVLKLGHHGSRTSSSPRFIEAVAPAIGLASVGAANRYGHPSPETLAAFAEREIPVLRTDREGSIVVSSDGRRLVIRTRQERWALPLR